LLNFILVSNQRCSNTYDMLTKQKNLLVIFEYNLNNIVLLVNFQFLQ